MKAETIPMVGHGGHSAIYITHGARHFRLYGNWDDVAALFVVERFQQALAAHDAELDKTRFVELTEQNKQLRLQLCRIMAAGPGDIEATIRILQKHRDIQNHLVVTPSLREEVIELNRLLGVRDARIRVLEADVVEAKQFAKSFSNLASSWMEAYLTFKALTQRIS